MDNTFVSVVEGGRHTRILHKRRQQQNHFLGFVNKLTKKAVDAGVKKATGGNTEAAAKLQDAMKNDKAFQDQLKKVNNTGKAAVALSAILGGGALAAPVAGASGGAAAVGGTTAAKGGAAIAAASSAASALKKKADTGTITVKDITNAGEKIGKDLNVNTGIGQMAKNTEYFKELEKLGVQDSIKKIEEALPTEIKDQLKKEAKKAGKRLSETDIIANGRTSPELLPKNLKQKLSEELIQKQSDKKLNSNKMASGPSFGLSGELYVIVGMILFMIVVKMLSR